MRDYLIFLATVTLTCFAVYLLTSIALILIQGG